jgi:uncharacterized protein with HEPN domain
MKRPSWRAHCTRTRQSGPWKVIGEAAGKVSLATRTAHSEIPWREITGMRHRLIHGYADVRLDLVWVVLHDHLGPLITALEEVVPGESRGRQ